MLAGPAEAAITFLGAGNGHGTNTAAAPVDTTGATLLVVCLTTSSATPTVTDTKGNTWTKVVGPLTINDTSSLFFSVPTSVGTNHIFNNSGGSTTDTILAAAFSGIPGASMERSASQTQASLASGATISSSATAATLVADQVVMGCAQLSTNTTFTWTATGGATMAQSMGDAASNSTAALSYKIVSATGTQTATFTATTGGTAAALVATFKAGVVDTQVPTTPGGCVATTTGSFSTSVLCSPSSDNVAVCNYNIRRCSTAACAPSTIVATPTTPTLTDTSLSASTLYRYTMQAVDCSANLSGQSAVVETTTSAVTECNYSWTAPASGVTPDAYNVRRCDTTAATCTPAAILATVTAPTVTYKDAACPQPVVCIDVNASATGFGSAFTPVVCVSTTAQTTPILSVSPPSLVFAATINGANPASQTLTVTNSTASTMNWTGAKDQAWLSSLVPNSGTNTTQVTVNVSISGLTAGTYQGNITVSAPGATNSPVGVPVTLNLSPAVTPASGRSGRVR